jgi:hypothetical protein
VPEQVGADVAGTCIGMQRLRQGAIAEQGTTRVEKHFATRVAACRLPPAAGLDAVIYKTVVVLPRACNTPMRCD